MDIAEPLNKITKCTLIEKEKFYSLLNASRVWTLTTGLLRYPPGMGQIEPSLGGSRSRQSNSAHSPWFELHFLLRELSLVTYLNVRPEVHLALWVPLRVLNWRLALTTVRQRSQL
jgi:hypothetical protein